jgi:hypothetical protein
MPIAERLSRSEGTPKHGPGRYELQVAAGSDRFALLPDRSARHTRVNVASLVCTQRDIRAALRSDPDLAGVGGNDVESASILGNHNSALQSGPMESGFSGWKNLRGLWRMETFSDHADLPQRLNLLFTFPAQYR